MRRVLLVDGGGTSTRLRLIEGERIVGAGRAGPSSLTLGVEQAWESIRRALRQAGDAGPAPVLWAGLAGGRSAPRREAFRAADPLGCAEIEIVTDGLAALTGAFAGGPGAMLAIGTGVTAMARGADGTVVESSGWGFPLGDEGGGAWLGRRAAQALSRALDGRAPRDSTLLDALVAEIGGDFDAIQLWLSDADATRFASLAPLVAATEEDALAAALLDEAAAEAALALRAVEAQAGEGPVALLGGLADLLGARLPDSIRARMVTPQGGALDGLARLAGI